MEPAIWRRPPVRLLLSALVSSSLYFELTSLSHELTSRSARQERPLMAVLAVFCLLFAVYLIQVSVVLHHCRQDDPRQPRSSRILAVIVVMAIVFRAILLPGEPVLEVDAYRYLWDGHVVASGLNPYACSPGQVSAVLHDRPGGSSATARELAGHCDRRPELRDLLTRVHFPELTTVYPPVSQLVFGVASCVTPATAGIHQRVQIWKLFTVAFDLATLWILIRLLRFLNRPPEWSIIYAWCPLVLKEFANSGHLDSIAVFLTMASLSIAVRTLAGMSRDREPEAPIGEGGNRSGPGRPAGRLLAATVLLVLGVGAKLYPIILFPMLLLSIDRRIGRRIAIASALLFVALVLLLVAPMLRSVESGPGSDASIDEESPLAGTGLGAFATRWRMNDFLFQLPYENLVPTGSRGSSPEPWFVITSESWRQATVEQLGEWFSVPQPQVPFVVTRVLTMALFAVLVACWSFQAAREPDGEFWLRRAFLSVAWFWLLQPTQNPWYWTWAMPLLVFGGRAAWLLMSGLVLTYYARFWFIDRTAAGPLLGTPYSGAEFFDFVLVWFEFVPVLLALAAEGFVAQRGKPWKIRSGDDTGRLTDSA